jgi:hypothetical protein
MRIHRGWYCEHRVTRHRLPEDKLEVREMFQLFKKPTYQPLVVYSRGRTGIQISLCTFLMRKVCYSDATAARYFQNHYHWHRILCRGRHQRVAPGELLHLKIAPTGDPWHCDSAEAMISPYRRSAYQISVLMSLYWRHMSMQ